MKGGGGCCAVCKVVAALAGIGALNWGFVGIFGVDLVAKLLGDMTLPAKIVYGLVGVAGVLTLLNLVGVRCPCSKGEGACQTKA